MHKTTGRLTQEDARGCVVPFPEKTSEMTMAILWCFKLISELYGSVLRWNQESFKCYSWHYFSNYLCLDTTLHLQDSLLCCSICMQRFEPRCDPWWFERHVTSDTFGSDGGCSHYGWELANVESSMSCATLLLQLSTNKPIASLTYK